jgi:hypothetical protein
MLIGGIYTWAIFDWPGLIDGTGDMVYIYFFVFILMSVFLFVFALPGVVASIGLLKIKKWARIMMFPVSVIHMTAFPIGTVLGVYAIVILLLKQTKDLFNEEKEPEPKLLKSLL